jgi:hypothetical protein
MNEALIDLQALQERLGKVERQNYRLKLWGILIAGLLLVGGYGEVPSKSISAEKISLVDKDGKVRLTMDLDEGTPRIRFIYENGDPSLLMYGDELCFYDHGKKARISLTAKEVMNLSRLSIADKEGKNCVTLGAAPDGPYLSLDDHEEKKEVILGIESMEILNSPETSGAKR